MLRTPIVLALLFAWAAGAEAPPSPQPDPQPRAAEIQRLIDARREQMQAEQRVADSAAATAPVSTYLAKSLRVEQLIVGGQPQEVDLAPLKDAGVTRVINLRTPEEMKTLGFDEGALLASQGLAYKELPLGGSEFPYSPALLEAFAAEMAATKGIVLLHCASGGRAGMLYAAWLVKYRGQTPEQAMRTLEPLGGWPLPLEKLLGRPLTVEFPQPQAD